MAFRLCRFMPLVSTVCVLVFFSAFLASAATIRVPSEQPTIQAGIDASVDGDTVLVADGTYTGTGNKNIDFHGKAITVLSVGGADAAVIDCENSGRGFYFSSDEGPSSRLDGFTIRNGNLWDANGGGISCSNASPLIRNCSLYKNNVDGYYLSAGGGFSCAGTSNPVIDNLLISENTAKDFGGGIICKDSSSPAITNCDISQNVSGQNGGGISCFDNASPTITGCTIKGNSASGMSWLNMGAGMFCGGYSSPDIANCLFADNVCDGSGGGIYNGSPAHSRFLNCTITGNTAPKGGGGLIVDHDSPVIANCILWNNYPDEISSHASPTIVYSDIKGGWPGEGNINADPFFVDPANGDFHLSIISPCIDAGTYTGDIVDIDGETRPNGAGFDIGADEYYPSGGLEVFFLEYADTVAAGHSLDYIAGIGNTGSEPLSFDEASFRVTGPAQKEVTFYPGPPLQVEPGEFIQTIQYAIVSGSAPPGSYIFTVNAYGQVPGCPAPPSTWRSCRAGESGKLSSEEPG